MTQESLQIKIGYIFNDKTLLTQALTHPSAKSSSEDSKLDADYERLELLGDAVLQLVITDCLIKSYPKKNEGDLTKLRSLLVCKQNLYKTALMLDLRSLVKLGSSLKEQRKNLNSKMLSNLVEALIGAIYLDADDFSAAFTVVKNFVTKFIWRPTNELLSNLSAKSVLNEELQKKQLGSQYILTKARAGIDDCLFYVDLFVAGKKIASGKGDSKKEAEEAAASLALTKQSDILNGIIA